MLMNLDVKQLNELCVNVSNEFVQSPLARFTTGASFKSQKNNASATHFSRSLRNPLRDFAGNVQGLFFRPQPHLPSFIQIHPSVRDLLAKTTFQIVQYTAIRLPITRLSQGLNLWGWAGQGFLRKIYNCTNPPP